MKKSALLAELHFIRDGAEEISDGMLLAWSVIAALMNYLNDAEIRYAIDEIPL